MLETELVILITAAFIAGALDSVAGGGSLITLPVMMLQGLPPLTAIGTGKLQGTVVTGSASWFLLKNRYCKPISSRVVILLTLVMSASGACFILHTDPQFIDILVPYSLFAIGLIYLLLPRLNKMTVIQKTPAIPFYCLVSFYDGCLGPGTGSYFTLIESKLKKIDLLLASYNARQLNFLTNIAGLTVFAVYGHLDLKVGICMAFGGLLGARLGAKILVKISPDNVRWIIIACSVILLIKLLFNG